MLERLAAAESPAESYRLLIDYTNIATPLEFRAVAAQAASLSAPTRRAIEAVTGMMERSHANTRRFMRQGLAPGINFYAGASKGPKHLVVVFTGNQLRPFLPLPVFLQHVPGRHFDVLVLQDASRQWFLRGIPGVLDSIAELPRWLSSTLPSFQYLSVRSVGTSAGGAAALYGGIVLGAARSLSIGGSPPKFATQLPQEPELDRTVFDRMVAAQLPLHTGVLHACYGADNAKDAEGAARLREHLPALRCTGFPGLSDHNLPFDLWKQGQLHAFMRDHLLGGIDNNRNST